ncbi:MAG: flavodoxin family protein [Candidatus Aminicenantes bacterium]|jgi:multimeric flavodoxin WrbA|nr:flavodoxin family protein [Candidatus Aminicenantes bacterium]
MKAVFLKGSPPAGRDLLCNRAAAAVISIMNARGWQVKAFALAGMEIKPCRGCFSCWVKTPGRCVISDDDQEPILQAWAGADLIAFLTPITFGGYAPELKKAMDRIIPVLLPFFMQIRGETHHPQRYPHRRSLLAIGTQKQEDAESENVFCQLVQRNALNMGDVQVSTLVFSGDVSLAEIEKRLGGEPLFREVVK